MARTTRDKGVSLARLPALIIGSILLTFGLLAFLADGTSPTDGFPDATIRDAETFLGIGVNDWTAFFTAAAGGLLLFGAAQHLLAKTMSLIVGLALGACSVIALVDGDDVLGLAAANGWTKLGWGAAAAALLINALLRRKGGKDHDVDHDRDVVRDRDVRREPVPVPRREPVATQRVEPVETRRADTVETHPVESHPVEGTRRRVEETSDAPTGRFDRQDHDGVVTDGRADGPVSDERLRDDRIR